MTMTRDEANEWVQSNIVVHMVDMGEPNGVWVHTHGLAAHSLPELEIRGVRPLFLAYSAARMLNSIAAYMKASGRIVRVGETMTCANDAPVRFQALPKLDAGDGSYPADAVVLTVCALPVVCAACGDPHDKDAAHAPDTRAAASDSDA